MQSYTAEGTVAKDGLGKPYKPSVPAYSNEWAKFDSQQNLTEQHYEMMSTIKTYKISNKELLMALVEMEVIKDIAGWSVKTAYGQYAGQPYFYIVKKNVPPISIDEYITLKDEGYADKITTKASIRYRNSSNGPTYTESYSYAATYKSTVRTIIQLNFGYLDFQGVVTSGEAYKAFGSGEDQYWCYVPTAVKFGAISGSVYYEQSEDASVLEGTWSIAAAKALPDISNLYPEANQDQLSE